ncbi:hypothetical protein F4861DRAFT_542613 [Xylaria intraflava]|nr:hypothetical protein F4861DRAFT_542613 [Xylaria intraflava]
MANTDIYSESFAFELIEVAIPPEITIYYSPNNGPKDMENEPLPPRLNEAYHVGFWFFGPKNAEIPYLFCFDDRGRYRGHIWNLGGVLIDAIMQGFILGIRIFNVENDMVARGTVAWTEWSDGDEMFDGTEASV